MEKETFEIQTVKYLVKRFEFVEAESRFGEDLMCVRVELEPHHRHEQVIELGNKGLSLDLFPQTLSVTLNHNQELFELLKSGAHVIDFDFVLSNIGFGINCRDKLILDNFVKLEYSVERSFVFPSAKSAAPLPS